MCKTPAAEEAFKCIALSSPAPVLREPGRCDQFHVTVEGSLDHADLGDLCHADDFGRVIAYTASTGWVDPAGTAVRAHVQR